MLNNFIVAVEAVIPLFCLMAIGVMIKRYKMLSPDEVKHLNRAVFTIFFGIMMFYNLYTADFTQTVRPDLMAFCALGVLATCLIGGLIVCFFEKCNKRRGAMIQILFRSNFVIMGMPIAANIYGSEILGVTTLMIAIIVPMYNVLAVLILETFRGGSINPIHILKGIAKNTMIVGAALGLVFQLVGIELPKFLMNPLAQVTAATTPMALIILGASFSMANTLADKKTVALMTAARLVIVPAVFLPLAAYLGFRGVDFVTILTVFCPPCAVAGFAMAQQMNSDADLAGACVVSTSALSCFTIFGWVFISKTLGLF